MTRLLAVLLLVLVGAGPGQSDPVTDSTEFTGIPTLPTRRTVAPLIDVTPVTRPKAVM